MCVISTPSSRMVPSVGCSNPAISRSVVVLPQPEGPSREKNSPLSTVRLTLSTAISVKRLVSPTSSTRPPAIGPPFQSSAPAHGSSALAHPPARLAPPAARVRPAEPELPGRETHAQLECPVGVDRRVAERDLHRQPVEQRRKQHGEIHRVDRAELARLLALDHQGADRVPPPLVELLPDGGHLRVAHRLCPQVQPQGP